MGYGVTAEPVAFVYNRRLIPAGRVPRTHEAFEALLRAGRKPLTGKVATYDPARSNVGYLYLTEDYAITRDTRSLVQAMAATRPWLSPTTEPMLDAVADGRIAIAYNVVGPYALTAAKRDPRIGVVFPRDYTLVASRVAFIARNAQRPAGRSCSSISCCRARAKGCSRSNGCCRCAAMSARRACRPNSSARSASAPAFSSISIRSSAGGSSPNGARS